MDIDNEKMNVTEEAGAASAQTEIDEQTWREITGGEPDGKTKVGAENKSQYTVDQILSRIESIRKETTYFVALEAMKTFQPSNAPDGGKSDAERAKTILEIFRLHEETLQKELDLLGKMYDDLTK